jgi:hypothetical protein
MLPLIPQDKANHFAYGAAVSTVVFVAAAQFQTLSPFAHVFALVGAVLVGVAKEGVDYLRAKRNPAAKGVDKLDILWTALGGVPAFVVGIVA